MSAEETSSRIKQAALKRFVEVGYGSTTVDEIAAGAKVGVASLYRRWPDKAALANELVVDYLAVVDEVLAPVSGGTRKARFLILWDRLWVHAHDNPDHLLFSEAQVHAGFMTAETEALKLSASERWIPAITEFGIGADPLTATSIIIGTLTSVIRGGLELDRAELGERLWSALRTE